jgi:hypothetical protein
MSSNVIDLTGDSDEDDVSVTARRVRQRTDTMRASEEEEDGSQDNEEEEEEEEDKDGDGGERHHPGELEVDYDRWDDHDEACHGIIDSNALRREYPENYIWSCCGRSGDECGCTCGKGPGVDEMYATSPEPELEWSERYHPGELEVDWQSDIWADHDEDCHGPIDTKTNRSEAPDGFRWSCCSEVGTYAEGCQLCDG